MKWNVFLVVLLASLTTSAREPRFDDLAKKFEFSSWKGTVKADYKRVLESYNLPDLSLKTNSPAFHVRERWDRTGRIHSLKVAGLRIKTVVMTNVVAAQEYMINDYAFYSVLPVDKTHNGIGDRGCGNRSKWGSYVNFTRNNVFVHVGFDDFTGTRKDLFSVEAIARKIDEDILKKSTSRSFFTWLKGE